MGNLKIREVNIAGETMVIAGFSKYLVGMSLRHNNASKEHSLRLEPSKEGSTSHGGGVLSRMERLAISQKVREDDEVEGGRFERRVDSS